MSDFELLAHYESIIRTLTQTSIALADKPRSEDVDVSILGMPCKMNVTELKEHIVMQVEFFSRMLAMVQDRITRNEGKVA